MDYVTKSLRIVSTYGFCIRYSQAMKSFVNIIIESPSTTVSKQYGEESKGRGSDRPEILEVTRQIGWMLCRSRTVKMSIFTPSPWAVTTSRTRLWELIRSRDRAFRYVMSASPMCSCHEPCEVCMTTIIPAARYHCFFTLGWALTLWLSFRPVAWQLTARYWAMTQRPRD